MIEETIETMDGGVVDKVRVAKELHKKFGKNAVNGQLVTEPFTEKGIEAKVNSGFASINQKATLRGLRVVVGNKTIPAGAVVYLNAEAYASPWAKKIYKQENMFDGKEFIVIPDNLVIFWEWY